MDLNNIIPNMEKTFGVLEYAGEGKLYEQRINGRTEKVGRIYNLYSSVQKADSISVIIPITAGQKEFDFDERVKLVNPRIKAEGYKIGDNGYTNYIMYADDMIKG